MLNLYPERQTVFNSLPNAPNLELLRMNLDEIRRVILSFHPDVMLAYGDLLLGRGYLLESRDRIMGMLMRMGYGEVKVIRLTKRGNPKHPLCMSASTRLESLPISRFLSTSV